MARRLVILGLVLASATGMLAAAASAEETGTWSEGNRDNLRDRLSQSLRDLRTPPRFYWDRGVAIETQERSIAFHVGYEGQWDLTRYDGMEAAVEAAAGDSWESGFNVRRSRVVIEGYLLRHWYVRARYGWEEFTKFSFQDLFVEWSGLRRFGQHRGPLIRLGQVKEPMTLDWMTSAFRTTFVERAMFTTSIVPNRAPGIRMHGNAFVDRMSYQFGAFALNAGELGTQGAEDGGGAITGRLTGLPWASSDSRRLLHLGISGSYRWGMDHERYRAKPESSIGPDVVDTGEFDADHVSVAAGELFWLHDRWSVKGEAAWNHVEFPDGRAGDYWGGYAQVSYFLTGKGVPYTREFATPGRVRPKCTIFCPARSGWGDFEVAARISLLDLTNSPVNGGRVADLTLGLNWYARDNIRASLNYIYTDVEDAYGVAGADGTMNTVVFRVQWDL